MAWLGLIIATTFTSIKFSWIDVALPFVSLFGIVIWFGGLALVLSLILPSRRLAASLTGLILAASYFITSFARISPSLKALAQLVAAHLLSGRQRRWKDSTPGDFAGLLLMSIVFVMLGMWLFQRRDIRIAGEGGWQLPFRSRQSRAA